LKNLFEKTSFAAVISQYPITFFDVGARGGFDTGLWPFAFGVDAIGFEPNPIEFEVLRKQAPEIWRNVQIFPYAIGDAVGSQKLYIPSDPRAASLLPPLGELPRHLDKQHFFHPVQNSDVETTTLDNLVSHEDIAMPDYLKIDIEGPELASLKASPSVLDSLLAVKIEVAFVQVRDNQPIAWEIESFMAENGFMLMDLIEPAHWRAHGHVVHPHMSNKKIPYSRGQLVHGDYLFLRNPRANNLTDKQIVKLGLISMGTGYFDFSEDLFTQQGILDLMHFKNSTEMTKALADCSRLYGKATARHEFVRHLRQLGPYIRRVRNLL
jgi:FkbM family methyltransferase